MCQWLSGSASNGNPVVLRRRKNSRRPTTSGHESRHDDTAFPCDESQERSTPACTGAGAPAPAATLANRSWYISFHRFSRCDDADPGSSGSELIPALLQFVADVGEGIGQLGADGRDG